MFFIAPVAATWTHSRCYASDGLSYHQTWSSTMWVFGWVGDNVPWTCTVFLGRLCFPPALLCFWEPLSWRCLRCLFSAVKKTMRRMSTCLNPMALAATYWHCGRPKPLPCLAIVDLKEEVFSLNLQIKVFCFQQHLIRLFALTSWRNYDFYLFIVKNKNTRNGCGTNSWWSIGGMAPTKKFDI